MVHYIIKFKKGKGIKFISHLDLMRSIERAIRRAGIPILYSKGFNPHMELSFATPLSVGVWSMGEYMCFELEYELENTEIIDKLNDVLSEDIRIFSVKEVDSHYPSLMSIVDASSYEVTLVNIPQNKLNQNNIMKFLGRDTIEVTKHGKNGSKVIDIKPMIYRLELSMTEDGSAVLSTTIASGSRNNLNPELLVQALRSFVEGTEGMEIRDICKNETYIKREELFLTPMEI